MGCHNVEINISPMFIRYSFSFETLLTCAYVNVLKFKYWRIHILAANIAII